MIKKETNQNEAGEVKKDIPSDVMDRWEEISYYDACCEDCCCD